MMPESALILAGALRRAHTLAHLRRTNVSDELVSAHALDLYRHMKSVELSKGEPLSDREASLFADIRLKLRSFMKGQNNGSVFL